MTKINSKIASKKTSPKTATSLDLTSFLADAFDKVLNLYQSQEFSVKEIVEMTGVSRAAIYRYLNKNMK